MIKLFSPYVPEEAIEEVAKTLRSGCLAQGPRVDEFESEFSKKFEIALPISVNSGSSALEMAYELAGISPGDEVISTPLTCVATNLPLKKLGAKIIWADIQEDTLCLDPLSVSEKLTTNTRAIVQVHLGGIQANVGFRHIPVISDAAQALGIFNGDYVCCSFQAIKHITTGDGGMLILNNKYDYHLAKLMRWFGIDRTRKPENNWETYRTRMMSYNVELPGEKRHMNDIAATMGLVGLKHYDKVIAHREKLFNIYRNRIGEGNVQGLWLVDGKVNTYWLCTILVENRDDFAKMMFEAGIETNLVQVRNDTYRIFGGERADLPVLNKIEDKYLSIPIGTHVTEDEVNYICDKIEEGWGV